jgi:hypothetical protein
MFTSLYVKLGLVLILSVYIDGLDTVVVDDDGAFTYPLFRDGACTYPCLDYGACTYPLLDHGACTYPLLGDGACTSPLFQTLVSCLYFNNNNNKITEGISVAHLRTMTLMVP